MGSGILLSIGIVNIISLTMLSSEKHWINILNGIIYIFSSIGSVLLDADRHNKFMVVCFLTFTVISIVWGVILGVVIIAIPDYFINCTKTNKLECNYTKSVLPEFVGAIYIGSSLLSMYFWNSVYSFYRLLSVTDMCRA